MGNSSRLSASIERLLNLAGKSRRRKRRLAKLHKVTHRALAVQSLEHRWLMSAEGVGELVELQTQVLDSSGFVMQPVIVDGVPEYLVGTGEHFSIRTQARDLRSNASGLFAVFTELNYATVGNPSAELAQLQWGELLDIRIPTRTTGGSFTLTNGSESTTAIAFTSDRELLSERIRNAIGSLPSVQGVNNVRIQRYFDAETLAFHVSFIGSLARRDVPNLVVGSNNLTSPTGSVSIQTTSSSDLSDKLVVAASISNPRNQIGSNLFLTYNGASPEANLQFSPATGNRIKSLGNIAQTSIPPALDDPNQFVSIVDASFRAANAPGIVEFKTEPNSNSRLPILLWGSEVVVQNNEIDFPDPFRIRIAEKTFQNPVSRFDVNADGFISPVDSIFVTRHLAVAGTSQILQNSFPPPPFLDVDGDLFASPIDTLQIVNDIKRGGIRALSGEGPVSQTNSPEGAGELAQVDIQILDTNGAVRSSQLVGGVPEFVVNPGEKFTIRTRARDLRSPNAAGVFSTYTDIQLVNQGTNEELLKVLWGELQTIKFPRGISTGSFSLSFGTEATAPIAFTADINDLRTRMENAIGALAFVGGAQNIRVNVSSITDPDFDRQVQISFVGDQSRKNIPDVVVTNNNLTSSIFGSTTPQVSATTDLANRYVIGAAMSYPVNRDASNFAVVYSGGAPEASIETISGGYRLNEVGGFVGLPVAPSLQGEFANVVDTAFQASNGPGVIDINVTPTGRRLLGVALYGIDTPVPEASLEFPSSFRIRIADLIEAKNDRTTVIEDSQPILLDPLSNDVLGTSGTVFVLSVIQPSNNAGSVAIEPSGLRYTPKADFAGMTSFTYTISDAFGNRSTATVSIDVTPVNDTPVANTFATNVLEDSESNFNSVVILVGDLPGPPEAFDEHQNQTMTIIDVDRTTSKGGIITPNFSGTSAILSLNYKPAADFVGTDEFTYTLSDNFGTGPLTTKGTITINVEAVNDAPTASNDGEFVVASNATTNLNVLANDNDIDNQIDVASVEIIQAAGKGVTTRLPNGQIFYRPYAGSRGTDSFTYRVADSSSSTSNEATVSITINPAPVAVADTKAYLVGDTIEIQILANDTDEDGIATINRGSIAIVTPPAVGDVTILQDGNLRYSPPAGFKGTATFEYTITDNRTAISDPGIVTLEIVDSFHQNPRNRYDVDGDGDVAPLDVLQVINALKRIGPRELGRDEYLPRPYIDVDGSRSLEPLDVLQVINFLRRRTVTPTSEGEAVSSIEADREKQALDERFLVDPSDYAATIRKRIALTDAAFADEI